MKIGLALGGGGSRGFAHLGVAKALRELEVPISCVSGTSIGSIVGGIMAADMLKRALNWAFEPDWLKLPGLFLKWHLPWRSVLGSERIESFFREMICAQTFDELFMPFAAVATDLFSGETVVMQTGDLQSAIRASMSIPGVFEPVRREGHILVDGGLTNPLPVDVCRTMGADKVIAVDINAHTADSASVSYEKLNMLGIVDRTFTIVCNKMAEANLARHPADFVLRPPVGDSRMMDFRGGERLIEIGYKYAMAHAHEIKSLMAAK